ncbi:MAG TPA: VWA domain-containing protein [Thermoanaerobaculia bacterium]|nr:VWA domain-containing protein [Thermoanaerobaculia bacterium]
MSFRVLPILWLLAALPFVLWFFLARERTRTRIARQFASERLRGVSMPLRSLRPWLLVLALLLAIFALAGPYSGFTLVPITAREANRVLVIDVSNSMAAEDVGASRLAAAKAIARRIADAHNGRIALIVFEAQPEIVSPLTTDSDAVGALLDTLQAGEVGQPGSDLGTAIIAALRLVEGDVQQKVDFVVLSDGEDQGVRVAEAIQRAKARGIAISTIVVGSSEGATIPTGAGPMRDSTGEVVTTYARADVLRDVAKQTGGTMLENPFAEHALDPLLRTGGVTARETHVRVPIDRYQWPLAFAFAALFFASVLHRGAE